MVVIVISNIILDYPIVKCINTFMQIKKTYSILQFAKVLVGDSKKPTKPINQKTRKRYND